MEDILHRFCGQFSSNASTCSEEKLEDFRSYVSKESFRNRVPMLIYLLFVGVVGMVGNTIVVLVYWFRFSSSSKRVFILSMGLCDLLMNIVTTPIKVVAIRHAYDTEVWMCKAELMLEAYPALLSLLILYAVAVDRCNRVCRHHGRQLSVRQSLYVVGTFAIATTALVSPLYVANGAARLDTAVAGVQVIMCAIDPNQSWADTALTVVSSTILGTGLLVLLACYGCIFVKIRNSNRRVTRHSGVSSKKASTKLSWRADGHAQPLPGPDKSELKDGQDLPFDSAANPRPRREAHDSPMRQRGSQLVFASHVNTNGVARAATPQPVVSFERARTAEQRRASLPLLLRDSVFSIRNESSTLTWIEQRRASLAQSSRSSPPYISIATTVFGNQSTRSDTKKPRTVGNSTRTMAVLSVVFLVDFVPFFITSQMLTKSNRWCEHLTDCGNNLFAIAHLSFYVNSMANPLVYSFANKKFRDSCVGLFRHWCRKL